MQRSADRIELAEGVDRHSFIPNPPALERGEYDPGAVGTILDRLRNAAVTRLISLDPLEHPDLALSASAFPTVSRCSSLHVYDARSALGPGPMSPAVSCRMADRDRGDRGALRRRLRSGRRRGPRAARHGLVPRRERSAHASFAPGRGKPTTSTLDGPGVLVMRDSFTPSWRATRGRDARDRAAGERPPPGRAAPRRRRHVVVLRYHPPGLGPGLAGHRAGGPRRRLARALASAARPWPRAEPLGRRAPLVGGIRCSTALLSLAANPGGDLAGSHLLLPRLRDHVPAPPRPVPARAAVGALDLLESLLVRGLGTASDAVPA